MTTARERFLAGDDRVRGVRPEVATSWYRCREQYHVDPRLVRAPPASAHDEASAEHTLEHAVVFIDEVEEIAGERGGKPPSPLQGVTNELLKIIPAFREQPGRLLVCATNMVGQLDSCEAAPVQVQTDGRIRECRFMNLGAGQTVGERTRREATGNTRNNDPTAFNR